VQHVQHVSIEDWFANAMFCSVLPYLTEMQIKKLKVSDISLCISVALWHVIRFWHWGSWVRIAAQVIFWLSLFHGLLPKQEL
jgi:hypothetical protein